MTNAAAPYPSQQKWLEDQLAARKAQLRMVHAIEELQHANAALVARALAAEKRAENAERQIRMNLARQGTVAAQPRYPRRQP